jgi:sarcosine oxidase subunit gamma
MAEPVAALAGLSASAGSGRVSLGEVSAGTILRVQTWPDTAEAFRRVARDVIDIEAPPLGRAATKSDVTSAALGPGIYLVAGLHEEMAWLVQEALPASDAAVTDWSHGRTLLSLQGEAAADVLQKCVAIDFSPAAFPPGRVAATMIHHIDVLILRPSETEFRLLTLRSFAEALAEWLLDAGLEEGIGFRRPTTGRA